MCSKAKLWYCPTWSANQNAALRRWICIRLCLRGVKCGSSNRLVERVPEISQRILEVHELTQIPLKKSSFEMLIYLAYPFQSSSSLTTQLITYPPAHLSPSSLPPTIQLTPHPHPQPPPSRPSPKTPTQHTSTSIQ